jgi:hypothetical protein
MAFLASIYSGAKAPIVLPPGETPETVLARCYLQPEGEMAWSMKVEAFGGKFEGFGKTLDEARENLLRLIRNKVVEAGAT